MGSTNPSYTSRLTKNLMAASIEAGVAPFAKEETIPHVSEASCHLLHPLPVWVRGHQGIRSGGPLRVFENLAQTLVAVDAS